jgi:two-component system sensor histidine kinase QseC
MHSLRRRLVLGTGAGAVIVLLAAGLMLYPLIAGALWREFDDALATRARAMAAMTEQEGSKIEIDFDETPLPEFEPSDHSEYYQVRRDGRQSYRRSPSLTDRDLPFVEAPIGQMVWQSVRLPDGRPGRLVAHRFVPQPEDREARVDPVELTLVVAKSTAPLKSTLARIVAAMLGVGALAVLATLLVLGWSVRRGMKPVDALAEQIENLNETALKARVGVAGLPAELVPVVDRLNALLARLDEAFQREKLFTANVAHELRTPLAGLRSILDVALSHPRDSREYQAVLRNAQQIDRQMERIVENLLHLARADAGQLEIHTEPVELEETARASWVPFADAADQRDLHVTWKSEGPCRVRTDPEKLRLVLRNLLGNAVAHADRGGTIEIVSECDNGTVEFSVKNSGSALTPEEAGHVFDRFWRGDQARSSNGQHCGLGLSLCKTLIELMGGRITATSTKRGDFEVRIQLPTA